jgi:hypothetical protein
MVELKGLAGHLLVSAPVCDVSVTGGVGSLFHFLPSIDGIRRWQEMKKAPDTPNVTNRSPSAGRGPAANQLE